MTKTLEELTELIIKWGAKKGIYDNSSYEYQLNKTLEEVTELHKAILDNDVEQIKDAIGDIYVTLVMAGQFELNLRLAITRYIGENKHQEYQRLYDNGNYDIKEWTKEELAQSCFVWIHYCALSGLYQKNQDNIEEAEYYLEEIIERLIVIGLAHDLEFTDCVEHAYNIISKRTGKMTNGQFIKDE